MIEVLKQMVEALEWCHGGEPVGTAEAIQAGKKLIADLESQEPVTRYCCHSCFKTSGGVMLGRMIVCPTCKNKRCPKASDHTLQCTNSNDPNQTGSIYTHPPQRKPLTDEQIQDAVNDAVRAKTLLWVGYIKDNEPVLSPSNYQFARAIEAAHGIKGES